MFIRCLDCAFYVLMAPPTLAIILWLKNHIFTFSTSFLKQPAMALHIMPEDSLNLGHNNLVEL